MVVGENPARRKRRSLGFDAGGGRGGGETVTGCGNPGYLRKGLS